MAKDDARYVWVGRPGSFSHAATVGREKRTLCGLRVGRDWLRASGKGHPTYRAKCRACSDAVRSADRVLARVAGHKTVDPEKEPVRVGTLQRARRLMLRYDLKEMLAELFRRGKEPAKTLEEAREALKGGEERL